MMSSILSFSGPKLTTRRLTLAALLVALQVILGKLSVGDPAVLKVGLGFIATAIIGYYLGPWIGGLAMVVADLNSNLLLSNGTMFFPGFTFSAFISGVIAGMFLYQQPVTLPRALAYEFFQILITNVFFNTFWLYLMSMTSSSTVHSFMALLSVRIIKEVISWPIEGLVVYLILRRAQRLNLRIPN